MAFEWGFFSIYRLIGSFHHERLSERGMKQYRLIDHTADLGIEVYGKDLKELFQNAAEAFSEIVWDTSQVLESRQIDISVEGDGLEQLMVMWLGELLYIHETEGFLFKRFEIHEMGDSRIRATGYGENFYEERHLIRTEIKAVTYHQIQVRQQEDIWISRVIFDL